jgi:hypothetical protein
MAFVAGCPLEQLFVSAVTLAEIRFGIERVGEPSRRAELNDWLTHKVRPMFDQRVLQVTEDIILKWRSLVDTSDNSYRWWPLSDLSYALVAVYLILDILGAHYTYEQMPLGK